MLCQDVGCLLQEVPVTWSISVVTEGTRPATWIPESCAFGPSAEQMSMGVLFVQAAVNIVIFPGTPGRHLDVYWLRSRDSDKQLDGTGQAL